MRCAPSLPILLLLLLAPRADAANVVVRFTTALGDFDVELCTELSELCLGVAPNTVANFLSYVDSGAYQGSFVHRSVPGFVIQGGGFTANGTSFPVQQIDNGGVTVDSEFNQSNERGTVAVPLPSDPPDSTNPCDTDENGGSAGWFVSVADNSSLDCGLFTVFGVVVPPGMSVVDEINQLFRLNFGLGTTPLVDEYPCNPNPQGQCTTNPVPYFVYTEITRVPEPGSLAGAAAALAVGALAVRRRA